MSTRAAWHDLWLVEATRFLPLIGPKIFALPGTESGGPPLDFMCALAKTDIWSLLEKKPVYVQVDTTLYGDDYFLTASKGSSLFHTVKQWLFAF